MSDLELAGTSTPLEPFNSWQPSAVLLQSPTLGPQFSAAFFWGTGFVTATIPYDIMPTTEIENYTTCLCMSIGLLFNAFVIRRVAMPLLPPFSQTSPARYPYFRTT